MGRPSVVCGENKWSQVKAEFRLSSGRLRRKLDVLGQEESLHLRKGLLVQCRSQTEYVCLRVSCWQNKAETRGH